VAQFLISLTGVLILAGLAWGIAALLLGKDPGLEPAEPDGRGIPLPSVRPLTEADLGVVRFDTAPRGYRMLQVDSALRRAAYDIGYKEELIGVLEAEVAALRDGRLDEAEALRQAREAASRPRTEPDADDTVDDAVEDVVETEPVVLGTFQLGAGPTVGALPGEPAVLIPAGEPAAEAEEPPAEEAPAEEPDAQAPAEEPDAEADETAETAEPDATEPEPDEPETDVVTEPDDSVDGDAEPEATAEPAAEEPEAVEPDDSVDTDLAPAAKGGSDKPVRPADGER
jgi:DivIVA domain-containing protein